jgi:hypothetical protein
MHRPARAPPTTSQPPVTSVVLRLVEGVGNIAQARSDLQCVQQACNSRPVRCDDGSESAGPAHVGHRVTVSAVWQYGADRQCSTRGIHNGIPALDHLLRLDGATRGCPSLA